MKNLELKRRFKNKYVIRVAAGAVTIAVLGTSAGAYTVLAEKETTVQESQEEDGETVEKAKETLEKALSVGEENKEAGKEETVYVVANPDGSKKSVIVSEWLKNEDGAATIEDASDLKEIENVKGDETFTQKGDQVTWQADGKDIYYQGTTEKELPVTERVTYFMDGKEMSPEEMAGKSGKATIRFDYTNNEKTTQVIDGEEHEVYVPFTVMTGMILPEDYSNVEVTNGKVISDGDKKVVVGMAMPGLKESLGIEEGDLDEDVEIPDYVEVTAEVENFSLEMTMSIIMNDLVSEANLAENIDFDELDENIDTLTDASDQLLDGTKELSKGLGTLKNSMKEFASGVGTLKDGITNYTNGASQLNEGIKTLAGSSGTLASGVATLNNSAATLNKGVETLDQTLKAKMSKDEKDSLIKQADAAIDSTFSDKKTGTEAIKNQAASIFYDSLANNEGAKAQVAEGLNQYTAGVLDTVLSQTFDQVAAQGARNSAIAGNAHTAVEGAVVEVAKMVEKKTQDATADLTAGTIAALVQQTMQSSGKTNLTADEISNIITQAQTAVKNNQASVNIYDQVMAGVEAQKGAVASNAMSQLEATVDAQLPNNQAQIQAEAKNMKDQALSSAMSNENLKAAMNSTASQIVTGVAAGAKDTVGAAVADTAKTAAKTAAETATLTAVSATKAQISEAINAKDKTSGYSLVSGMKALSEGTNTMNDSVPALTAGIDQLKNGASTLVSNNGALVEGAGKLSSATTQIGDGVNKLAEGSDKLMDGMVQFDEEGIQKLLDAYNGDVKELLTKLEAVVEAGKDYQTFTKVADGTKGSVKFILRTEGIKADEEEE
ncbi:MAG: hypothetical protein HFH41_02220 [Lachnospiraceae bacterium]|nr:hypothetical protein [Lachnospiraceae bacterium]